jgi:hypothetical protein
MGVASPVATSTAVSTAGISVEGDVGRTRIRLSGDHDRSCPVPRPPRLGDSNTSRSGPPREGITTTTTRPARTRPNAIERPSGDHAGLNSISAPVVRR